MAADMVCLMTIAGVDADEPDVVHDVPWQLCIVFAGGAVLVYGG